jgi:hypothetical protein
MDGDIISEHFKKSKQNLQSEHDLMVENVKNDISSYKKKALSKISFVNIKIYYQFVIMRYFLIYQIQNNLKNYRFQRSFNLLIKPQNRAFS